MTATGGAQAVQDEFAAAIRKFMAERSTVIETTLFDLPTKIVLGQYCAYEAIPSVTAELDRRVAPGELGRRRRAVGVKLGLGLCGYLWIYLFGRLQRYLDEGWPDREVDLGDHEQTAKVIRYWENVARAYRGDGTLVAGTTRADGFIRCLDDDVIERVASAAIARGPANDVATVRRAIAQIELYCYLIHGEQRDGTFNHGPYELQDGSLLVLKELTDLQNQFMPWVTPERRLPVSRVVVPIVLRDVEAWFDMYGTLYTEPEDYFPHMIGMDILVGDDLKSTSEAQLGEIGQRAHEVQRDVFREMARWDDNYKLVHAATQYANVNHPLLELAGFSDDEIRRILIEPFERVSGDYVERARTNSATIWGYVASGREPLFPEVNA
jgi:hypothetical protein